ncbi:VOC family protein [Advenella mimigardefordensis]|uniref:Putative 3-demethylubiquinone-9 3-methyltransferase n=1 Tax=Advenella mimigardefordensis (strain DSM 17166 / LMG 22922 / DPN7) TaxID=1247726 RepID=W0PA09_ADVMD|nr:VOC family protein [Advenella mimigardefordensis]AHG62327.1 putative 3-demethylubiquinone-9 3-methyltransferase [Advenella mimigardefordensis DPN7]
MNQKSVTPYLFFGGTCEEALNFYKEAVGARVSMMMRFGESPEAPPPGTIPADYDNKIMHASFSIGSSILMASDGCGGASTFSGFSLSVTPESKEEATRMFNALAEGGTVTMALGETFFSPWFGMLKDRYGMEWMVAMQPAEQATQA